MFPGDSVSLYDREVSVIKSQQYACINKSSIMTKLTWIPMQTE